MKWRLALGCACLSLTAFTGCDDKTATSNSANSASNSQNAANSGTRTACTQDAECRSGVCGADGYCADSTGQNAANTCPDPGPCGNCDPNCRLNEVGGTDEPFVLDDNPDDDQSNGGVVLDPDGAITIDIQRIENQFIWIANTGEGTVSKIDTRTYTEVARYITGPDGSNNDPSRTSVNTYGDVFVGNRRGQSVTKIKTGDCPDQNSDGVVTTSTGPMDVKPWGEDECVVWNKRLANGGIIRAVAAQDARANDDTSRSSVWIGGWDGITWKLDSDTGDILVETPSPTRNYGFALDGRGNLYIAGRGNNAIGRINTLLCTDTASCAAEPCQGEGNEDTCVKQVIPIGDANPYGITVDFKQRVWVAGDKITRYDPSEPVGQRQVQVDSVFIHGIAADDQGFIWGAGMGSGVIRYDAEDPSQQFPVPGTDLSSKGMAIDLDGKVWSINLGDSSATVIEPGPTLQEATATTPVTTLVAPYTYSDMTGAQLRFASDQRGYYRRIFPGCENATPQLRTAWEELRFDASTPGGSSIAFSVRGADTREALENADWVQVAVFPPDTSPFDLATALEAAGLGGVNFIEVEAALTAVRDAQDNVHAPRLLSMAVSLTCPNVLQ